MERQADVQEQTLKRREIVPVVPLHERTGLRWLAGVAVVVVIGGLIALFVSLSGKESTDDAQIDGHINIVSARVAGTVVEVRVKDNESVTAGAVLVQLDRKDYEVALAKARSDLAEAEATSQAARAGVPLTTRTTTSQLTAAGSDVETARARLAAAEARLREIEANDTQASQDLERMKQLIAKDEISRQEYDSAVARAAAAHAARDSAKAEVEGARRGVEMALARLNQAETVPEQVAIMQARAASAEAKVQELRAALEQAQLNLEYTMIRAPVSGIVSRKAVEVGQSVQPGQALLALVPLEDTWVTANFKESQLRNMRPGQKAIVTVDAYGGRKFTGRVESIAAATGARFSLLPPENATGNYVKVVQRIPVKIVLDTGQDPDHLLRPGMSVVATVLLR
jgi:membrane fusion protein (multidrug efflux system)